jgi:hypothetical protein
LRGHRGGPQGGPQGPRGNHGARSSSNVDLSALQSLQSILNNYDLSSMSDEDETKIVAFLTSLTGKMPEVVYPVLPAETAATPRPTGQVK